MAQGREAMSERANSLKTSAAVKIRVNFLHLTTLLLLTFENLALRKLVDVTVKKETLFEPLGRVSANGRASLFLFSGRNSFLAKGSTVLIFWLLFYQEKSDVD